MSQEAQKTIPVKWFTPVQEEYVANAGITPGHLVELMSTGKVRVHATAGGNAEKTFALENELEGQGINDAYAATDPVQVGIFRTGDVVLAMLVDDGTAATIGAYLESAGDGTLQVHVADTGDHSSAEAGGVTAVLPNQIVAIALEALDLSGSSGEESSDILTTGRLLVRIV